jgi:metaxin
MVPRLAVGPVPLHVLSLTLSRKPTALDALVFAYLHTLLHSTESTRIQVARRPNLVAWERSVRTQVQAAFCLPTA